MSMSKRLQVVMSQEELESYRACADKLGLSLSEWARQVLRAAHDHQLGPSPSQKMQALDRALDCGHPTGDIDQILHEIEAGRGLR